MSSTPLDLPIRPRRLRRTPWLRALVAEHQLRAEDLIWPLFVQEGAGKVTPIEGLPGVERLSIDMVVDAAREALALGIPAIALFPVTPAALKTEDGREAFNPDNLMCRAIRAVKKAVPGIGVIADVALDPYTSHGHDGLLDATGEVANDATVASLCQQARVLAEAGCDIVAPSDMMDGRIGEIRATLDDAGHENTVILSYAAKYASALYGPFRAAVGSQSNLGKADKRSYQMNPANATEALREAALDLAEGADMLMVKPAGLYLDILARVKEIADVPVLAYHVSGEYAMLKAAAAAGFIDERAVTMETLLAIKRAGADAILTYAARDVARWLAQPDA
ncbi:MAG: porphobilinogen synthase [Alphaproteobacteria bacterium]|nr:porphobilinogen synthase [Alphaproteobacteria bacterium]